MYKMVVSGGLDKMLLLWNPYSCRPLGTMQGHAAPVVQVRGEVGGEVEVA
jgi:hypothetical protein